MSTPNTLSMLFNTSVPNHTSAAFNNRVGHSGQQSIGADSTADGDEIPYGGPRVFGTPVRFRLDEEWRRLKPRDMLSRLGFKRQWLPGADPEGQLLELINKRADELPLPDGCIVIRAQRFHPIIWSDPLTSLAILSKSSDILWLRSKTPSLRGAMYWLSATLIVPPSFSSYLPRVKI